MKSLTGDFDFTAFKQYMSETPSQENGWHVEKEIVKKDNPSN